MRFHWRGDASLQDVRTRCPAVLQPEQGQHFRGLRALPRRSPRRCGHPVAFSAGKLGWRPLRRPEPTMPAPAMRWKTSPRWSMTCATTMTRPSGHAWRANAKRLGARCGAGRPTARPLRGLAAADQRGAALASGAAAGKPQCRAASARFDPEDRRRSTSASPAAPSRLR